MDFTRFLMGFAHVDVCVAFRGWRCRSLPNAFPADKKSGQRLCAVHTVRCAGGVPATLMVMALQPTKRGAWCRADRKKSYKLGDLSLLIARLNAAGDAVEAIVGGGFRGADRGERAACVRLEPGRTYALLPLCMSAAPTAAEQTRAAPFTLRLGASERVLVSAAAPTARAALGALALQAVHAALLGGGPPRPPAGRGRAAELARLLLRAENAPLLVGGDAAPGASPASAARAPRSSPPPTAARSLWWSSTTWATSSRACARTAYAVDRARGAERPDRQSARRRRLVLSAALRAQRRAAAAAEVPALAARDAAERAASAGRRSGRATARSPPSPRRTRRLVLVLAASGMRRSSARRLRDCRRGGGGGGSGGSRRRQQQRGAARRGGVGRRDGVARAARRRGRGARRRIVGGAGASADGIRAAAPLGAARKLLARAATRRRR